MARAKSGRLAHARRPRHGLRAPCHAELFAREKLQQANFICLLYAMR